MGDQAEYMMFKQARELAVLKAELLRWRPVVEAAIAYEHLPDDHASNRLINAVKSAKAATPTPRPQP